MNRETSIHSSDTLVVVDRSRRRRMIIIGALVAGWLGHALGWYNTGEGAGFVAAIVGAFLLLLIYRLIAGRR